MRVRMTRSKRPALDQPSPRSEKEREHLDDYFGINPNGLVPTLVDNGVVHIESNDIDYLDETTTVRHSGQKTLI